MCCWFCCSTLKKLSSPSNNHPSLGTTTNFWQLWRVLRIDSSQSCRAPKCIMLHGPCTKYTYIKRPLTSPNHTLTTIHFILLSWKCWVDQGVERWPCGGMKEMIGECSFQSQSHLKAQKEVSFNFCTCKTFSIH